MKTRKHITYSIGITICALAFTACGKNEVVQPSTQNPIQGPAQDPVQDPVQEVVYYDHGTVISVVPSSDVPDTSGEPTMTGNHADLYPSRDVRPNVPIDGEVNEDIDQVPE